MCGCLLCIPKWGPGLQPRHVPWLGIKLVTLWFAGRHSIHWATPVRAHWLILVCALTGDQTCDLDVLGQCSTQLSYPARVLLVFQFMWLGEGVNGWTAVASSKQLCFPKPCIDARARTDARSQLGENRVFESKRPYSRVVWHSEPERPGFKP